ncbi:MAG: xanthine dehydrogenase family protein molybdopterin-binding subunit, partial [Pseudomonadota bacterium]
MKFGIGGSAKRVEDPTLLKGLGRYADDLPADGALHGFVLRSDAAHGILASIDATAARAAPGVVAVLTRDELQADGVGDIEAQATVKNADDSHQALMPWPILARDRVRYAGAPVAFVVAETLAQAKDAADLVEVEIEDLPVVVDTFEAAQPEAPRLWKHIPGSVVFDFARGDAEAVEAAFAKADRIVTARLVNNRLVSNAMEPRAATAFPGEDGRLRLDCPSQGPFFAHGQLCKMLGLAPERLRMTTGAVGGGFGTKAFLYPEAALTLWAAKRLNRVVRWTGGRSEIFPSDAHGRDNVAVAELALDADARFLGMRATTWAAMGAHLSNFGPIVPTQAAVGMYTGLYKIPAFHVTVKGVATNTVPVDAYRGAGRPEAAYLIERLVDVAAAECGLGRDEIRRRNFPTHEEMPHRMGLGDVIDSGDFPGLMTAALEKADFAGFESRRAESRARGRLRGFGFATYEERCAGGGGAPAKLRFDEDGDGLTVLMGTQDSGQGHAVAYAQILSDRLGVEIEDIRLVQGDTDAAPPGFTGGSKSIPVGAASVASASDKVKEKALDLGAHLLEAARADVEFLTDGEGPRVAVAGTDR